MIKLQNPIFVPVFLGLAPGTSCHRWALGKQTVRHNLTGRYLLRSALEINIVEGRGGKQDWAEGEIELQVQ